MSRGKDTADDPKRKAQPLNVVRGGSVCSPGGEGAHVLRGTYSPAVCMPTVGPDPRSRWRDPATMHNHRVNRHSVQAMQSRGTRTTQRGLGQLGGGNALGPYGR